MGNLAIQYPTIRKYESEIYSIDIYVPLLSNEYHHLPDSHPLGLINSKEMASILYAAYSGIYTPAAWKDKIKLVNFPEPSETKTGHLTNPNPLV